MTLWQRRARLLIAIFALGFVAMLPFAFKRRAPQAAAPAGIRTDPTALVESTGGRVMRFKRTREDATVEYEKQLTYKDGSTKLSGVRIVTEERTGSRSFTVTAKEGTLGHDESAIDLAGNVTLQASDGLTARTERATYAEADATVRAGGAVEFARRRLSGRGVGMTYEKNQDVLVILDQAQIHVVADGESGGATDIRSGGATVARQQKYIRFDRTMKAIRGRQVIEADNAVARLTEDEERIQSVELRGHSKITGEHAGPGELESLTGQDMDLTYASDGVTLQRVVINGDAVLRLAGQRGAAGREIAARTVDLTLAPDGTTPIALLGRDGVQLTFPADEGGESRVIKAGSMDARGLPKKGLTGAVLTGDVDYREKGPGINRVAKSGSLEMALKDGLSSIEEATFTRNARFATEGGLEAVAASARYVLDKGTLALQGSEPAAPRPHLTNEQIAVDANHVDVTLAGPLLKATGDVRSVLLPAKKGTATDKNETKMPSMLKGDQPVNVISEALDYDGGASKATYTGKAKLWQSDTSIQAQTLVIDNKTGDMTGSGDVATSAILEQGGKDKPAKERVRSIGTSKDFHYEESSRRATYTGSAHLSGPQGDMTASRIELYLQSGDELDRAEAYEQLTLREQNRTTTGARMTYTTSNETYLVTGIPVKIVDECGRETIGQRMTFVKATDTVNVDGNGQIRTQTKGKGNCR